jgi:hypothetical protein
MVLLNPMAKAKPRICLCGNPFVPGHKSRRYEIMQDVPGGAFRQSIYLQVSRPDGASCGECCIKSQKVVSFLPKSSSSSSSSSSSKPRDISGNQSPSSATFPPLFSRLGILAIQEIRRRMTGGG